MHALGLAWLLTCDINNDWLNDYVCYWCICELVLECYPNAIDVSTWKNKERDMTYRTKLIQGMYHFSLFFHEKNQTSWRSPNSEGISESGMFSYYKFIWFMG